MKTERSKSTAEIANLHSKHFIRALVLLAVFSLSEMSLIPAPNADLSLVGSVSDPSGGVIQGAKVSIVQIDTGFSKTVTTGEAGDYSFTNLSPGLYQVTAGYPGFVSRELKDIEIGGEALTLNIVLEVEAVSTKTVVESTAESDELESQRVEPIEAPIEPPQFIRRRLAKPPPILRGRFYADWFGSRNQAGFVSQISNRVKLEYGSVPGEGWTLRLDFRGRRRTGASEGGRVSLYDARITRDDWRSRYYFSFGQMNLYDTAGIGELLGGLAGRKFGKNLLVGGYYGFNPDLYSTRLDPQFRKTGAFLRVTGKKSQSLSLSVNQIKYAGQTERRFVYLNGLTSIEDRAFLYGNLEFELAGNVRSTDRLSRVFLNGRFDLSKKVDLTANFSSGKGLDFHQFLLDQMEGAVGNNRNLERYYFSNQYGVRLRYRATDRIRLYLGQRESENRDTLIHNRTTQLGFSASDLAETGFSLYANYNLNRGDRSESNSLYVSVSRSFGRYAWTGNYSSSFNGLRFNRSSLSPEVIHLANQHTVSNDFFITVNRTLGLSFQHEHTFVRDGAADLFFIRLILRM